ncbi:MAG: MBL fold metallo-hydrolase [Acidobacteriota bacterium]|nr:MBL fold metallo-hydrolase [Acidobacteriota bacterium]
MTRQRPLLLLTIATLGAIALAFGPVAARQGSPAETRPPGTNYKGPAWTFNKITDGVYHAVGTGSLVVMSNATIIEGDRDVLVVDTQVSPGGAWALREELKAITPKPIRWVVNSHYHFDHSHGNQIYGPEVQIIGHEFARQQMVAGKSQDSPAREFYVGGVPAAITGLEARLAAATDDTTRATIQNQLDIQRNHLEGTNGVKPTPPTLTLTHTMTLHLGSREVRIMFLGRGHTAGDIAVYLPGERMVATGDLLVNGTSYMGDAFVPDWINTIEALKKLDLGTVLPGHGAAFTDLSKLDHWQAYMRDFWAQAQKFHKAGTPWEEAAKLVDLRGNAVNYPMIRTAGLTPNHGMRRAYEILDGKVR